MKTQQDDMYGLKKCARNLKWIKKLYKYQTGRLKMLRTLLSKFHEDLQSDYYDDVKLIDDFLLETPLKSELILNNPSF